MSFKMGSFLSAAKAGAFPAPGCSPIPALDSHDFQMSSNTPSSYDHNRLLAALSTHSESTSTSSAANYTCCGLPLNDLHALLDHFEESHVYVLDPPQEGGESNSSDSPTPGSGSTASSQPPSPTMESATLSPSILPYYADLRSLMASAIPTGLMSPTSPGIEPPPESTAPSNLSTQMQLHGVPPSLLQSPPTPSSSNPAVKKGKASDRHGCRRTTRRRIHCRLWTRYCPPRSTTTHTGSHKFQQTVQVSHRALQQELQAGEWAEVSSHAWPVLLPSFVSDVQSDIRWWITPFGS